MTRTAEVNLNVASNGDGCMAVRRGSAACRAWRQWFRTTYREQDSRKGVDAAAQHDGGLASVDEGDERRITTMVLMDVWCGSVQIDS